MCNTQKIYKTQKNKATKAKQLQDTYSKVDMKLNN